MKKRKQLLKDHQIFYLFSIKGIDHNLISTLGDLDETSYFSNLCGDIKEISWRDCYKMVESPYIEDLYESKYYSWKRSWIFEAVKRGEKTLILKSFEIICTDIKGKTDSEKEFSKWIWQGGNDNRRFLCFDDNTKYVKDSEDIFYFLCYFSDVMKETDPNIQQEHALFVKSEKLSILYKKNIYDYALGKYSAITDYIGLDSLDTGKQSVLKALPDDCAKYVKDGFPLIESFGIYFLIEEINKNFGTSSFIQPIEIEHEKHIYIDSKAVKIIHKTITGKEISDYKLRLLRKEKLLNSYPLHVTMYRIDNFLSYLQSVTGYQKELTPFDIFNKIKNKK